jgi:hypothetical protein
MRQSNGVLPIMLVSVRFAFAQVMAGNFTARAICWAGLGLSKDRVAFAAWGWWMVDRIAPACFA